MKRGHLISVFLIFVVSTVLSFGCATRQTAGIPPDRTERIASMIARAEQLGARDCSPNTLAKVKVLLEKAIHEREEGHYPLAWTELKFDEAEKSARELLEVRVMAQNSGFPFRCIHGESNRGGRSHSGTRG